MFEQALPKTDISARDNLKWLFILRNLMLAGESLLIILTVYGMDIPLPQDSLWLVIGAIGAVNLYTWLRLKTDAPVTELEIFTQILLDVLGLTTLLYLTGGATNPMIWIYLLPLILTGIILPHAYTWYMVILTTSLYTFLITYHAPLPAIEPRFSEEPAMHDHVLAIREKNYFNLHIFGMWFGFVFSAGIVAYFVVELSNTLREQERKIAEIQAKQLRDERVVALGTLAASAAHDMGTPLGTIAILVHELEQTYPPHRFPDLVEKIHIIQKQVNRCKEALSVMSASAGEMRAESGQVMAVSTYIDEVLHQWRSQRPDIKLNLSIAPDQRLIEAQILADRTQTHSLINILNNAADVSPKDQGIDLRIDCADQQLVLEIRDYGPGFSEEMLAMIGQKPLATSKGHGLGVGLFLTYSSIHRLGGNIAVRNMPDGGACVTLRLPLLNCPQQTSSIHPSAEVIA